MKTPQKVIDKLDDVITGNRMQIARIQAEIDELDRLKDLLLTDFGWDLFKSSNKYSFLEKEGEGNEPKAT